MNTSTNSSYLAMLRAGKSITDNTGNLPELRVALLADHAPQQLAGVLAAAVMELGYFPRTYTADYGTAAFEAFDDKSDLRAFNAEIVIYSLAVQKYRDRFYTAADADNRDALPARYLEEVMGTVDALLAAGMAVVVSNLAVPLERMFGNYGAMTAQSLYGSVLRFNAILMDEVMQRRGCQLHDMAYLANAVGVRQFLDERVWSSSKYPCANQYLPEVARSMARAATARKGKITKVLVLDLDNTLWGGVIGDDGMEGIALGGDAYGEAFQQFQRYILSLRDRGYVLAVCSKNDEDLALEVFRRHPEMLIKESDISVFVANWNDKASNLDFIASTLKLSSDSFIFIDDSAFERDLVRSIMPNVGVPELPEDVADFSAAIEASGLLEATSFTREDRDRNAKYQEEAQRTTTQLKFGSIDDYLSSLGMRIQCLPFKPEDISRVGQLIQRSTQFNLRTQRLSDAACEGLMRDGEVTVAAKMADRFGDYGLIAAVCCVTQGEELFVTEFVMSCRVLKRGVEEYLMNHLFEECTRRGLKGVRGEYVRSSKNSIVQDFYRGFGFERGTVDGEKVEWYLSAADYRPRPTHIKEA